MSELLLMFENFFDPFEAFGGSQAADRRLINTILGAETVGR